MDVDIGVAVIVDSEREDDGVLVVVRGEDDLPSSRWLMSSVVRCRSSGVCRSAPQPDESSRPEIARMMGYGFMS